MTYTGPSVVDYLSSVGQASDFSSRAKLATQYGITNYTGTADQNTALLNYLRGGAQSTVNQSLYTPVQSTAPNQSLYTPNQSVYTPPTSTNQSNPYALPSSVQTAVNAVTGAVQNPTTLQQSPAYNSAGQPNFSTATPTYQTPAYGADGQTNFGSLPIPDSIYNTYRSLIQSGQLTPQQALVGIQAYEKTYGSKIDTNKLYGNLGDINLQNGVFTVDQNGNLVKKAATVSQTTVGGSGINNTTGAQGSTIKLPNGSTVQIDAKGNVISQSNPADAVPKTPVTVGPTDSVLSSDLVSSALGAPKTYNDILSKIYSSFLDFQKSYQEALVPSQAEKDAQANLDTLTNQQNQLAANTTAAQAYIQGKPISSPFMGADLQNLKEGAAAQGQLIASKIVPAQLQLQRLQEARAAQLKTVEAGYQFGKDSLSMALQIINQQNTAANQQRDDARSVLQNVITSFGGLTWDQLDTGTQTQLKTLAAKADFPVGLLQAGLKTLAEQKLAQNAIALQATQTQRDIQNSIALARLAITQGASGGMDEAGLMAAANYYAANGVFPPGTKNGQMGAIATAAQGVAQPEGSVLSQITGVKAKLSAPQQDGISALYNVVNDLLPKLQSTYDASYTGILPALGSAVGLRSDNLQSFLDTRTQVLNQMLVANSGKVVSDKELQRYQSLIPGAASQAAFLFGNGPQQLKDLQSSLRDKLDSYLANNRLKIVGYGDVSQESMAADSYLSASGLK